MSMIFSDGASLLALFAIALAIGFLIWDERTHQRDALTFKMLPPIEHSEIGKLNRHPARTNSEL